MSRQPTIFLLSLQFNSFGHNIKKQINSANTAMLLLLGSMEAKFMARMNQSADF